MESQVDLKFLYLCEQRGEKVPLWAGTTGFPGTAYIVPFSTIMQTPEFQVAQSPA